MIGWLVLLAITFTIQKSQLGTITKASYPALAIFETALSSAAAKAVILISTGRAAVLWHGLRDQRLPDDFRLLPRRRGPRS